MWVTSLWISYNTGRAVDIEHGIKTTTVRFDVGDIECWKSVEEVDAEWEIEHLQDYPRQEFTKIFTCDNGKKIREITPFFADEQMSEFEYVQDKY